jgi:hypothetical protein
LGGAHSWKHDRISLCSKFGVKLVEAVFPLEKIDSLPILNNEKSAQRNGVRPLFYPRHAQGPAYLRRGADEDSSAAMGADYLCGATAFHHYLDGQRQRARHAAVCARRRGVWCNRAAQRAGFLIYRATEKKRACGRRATASQRKRCMYRPKEDADKQQADTGKPE